MCLFLGILLLHQWCKLDDTVSVLGCIHCYHFDKSCSSFAVMSGNHLRSSFAGLMGQACHREKVKMENWNAQLLLAWNYWDIADHIVSQNSNWHSLHPEQTLQIFQYQMDKQEHQHLPFLLSHSFPKYRRKTSQVLNPCFLLEV